MRHKKPKAERNIEKQFKKNHRFNLWWQKTTSYITNIEKEFAQWDSVNSDLVG